MQVESKQQQLGE